jgi:uncharacterized protein YcbX
MDVSNIYHRLHEDLRLFNPQINASKESLLTILAALKSKLAKLEFTAGGLILYGVAFFMLAIPLVIFGIEYFLDSHKLAIPLPTRITELRVYPIKSCRGIVVKKAKLLKTGLDLDRTWMFVDAEKLEFLTIRQIARMTLINTAITEDDCLEVSIKNDPAAYFKIPAHPSRDWLEKNTELKTGVKIWNVSTDAWVYSEELTAPFEKLFRKPVRFVYKGPMPRILQGSGAPEVIGREETTNFPDQSPVLIANEKSIQDLNRRLEKNGSSGITIERFRPNIIVEGDRPWYEDVWKTARIVGRRDRVDTDITMDITHRCGRCRVSVAAHTLRDSTNPILGAMCRARNSEAALQRAMEYHDGIPSG